MARDFQEYRRPLWPMLAAFGSVSTVAACAIFVTVWGGYGSRPGVSAERSGAESPRSLSESAAHQTVKDYILDSANDPKSVEFAKWGPDDLEGKLHAAYMQFVGGTRPQFTMAPGEFLGKSDQIVRLKARAKNSNGALALTDVLVGLRNGKVSAVIENPFGDEWFGKWMEQFKKPQAPQ